MAEMHEAEHQAGMFDAHLLALGDDKYTGAAWDRFSDSLFDFRADGDLEAHVERMDVLLKEVQVQLPAEFATEPSWEGPLYRCWLSMFSSG